MADFDDIHRQQLYQADGNLRVGEIWSIALREPLRAVGAPSREDRITIVGFEAMPGGKLEPARDTDYEAIADWKRRHRDTPSGWFGLPEGLFTATTSHKPPQQ